MNCWASPEGTDEVAKEEWRQEDRRGVSASPYSPSSPLPASEDYTQLRLGLGDKNSGNLVAPFLPTQDPWGVWRHGCAWEPACRGGFYGRVSERMFERVGLMRERGVYVVGSSWHVNVGVDV